MTVGLVYVTTVPASLGFLHGHIGYLKDRGFKIQAISSPGEALDQFGSAEAIQVHAVSMERRMSPVRDLQSLATLCRTLRTLAPQIVHAITPKAALLAALAARRAGVPVVVVSVFGLPQMTRHGPMRMLLDGTTRISCRLADLVWCDSHSMREYVESARLCSAAKLVVLGQGSVGGVDAWRRFSPDRYGPVIGQQIRSRHGIPSHACVLGFVGRLVRDKGLNELVLAWHQLRSSYPELHLLLVGSAESEGALPAATWQLLRTDSRIHLAGQRSDVEQYLAAMDISVMPSYREGFGIANIEAAAMALPVVATRIPGCVDSVQDGVTGTLVPPGDDRALAAAIRGYLDDPELRRTHGQAGRQRVLRDFRPLSLWQALHHQYLSLLDKKSLGPPTGRGGDACPPSNIDQERRAA